MFFIILGKSFLTLAREAKERAENWSPSSSSDSPGFIVGGDGPLSSQMVANGGLNFPKGTTLNSPEYRPHLDPLSAMPRIANNSVNISGPKRVSKGISQRMLNMVHQNISTNGGSSICTDLNSAPRRSFSGGVIPANTQVDYNGAYYIPRKLF